MILFLILALILPILSRAMIVSIPGLGSIKGTSSKSEKGLDFYKFLGRVCQIERVWWLWRVYYVFHLSPILSYLSKYEWVYTLINKTSITINFEYIYVTRITVITKPK